MPEGFTYVYAPERGKFKTQEDADHAALRSAEAGQRLLNDEDFQLAFQELVEENLHQIIESKPGQWEVREDCYFRIRGIYEVAYKLRGWVSIAEQVQRRLAEESK